jgi:hypothetical protein
MQNPYRNFPGKPQIIDHKDIKSVEKIDFKDLVLPTLYGLNEKIIPGSELGNEFKKLWDNVSQDINNPSIGTYVYYPLRKTLVRYLDPHWHQMALLVSNSVLYNNPEGNLSWQEVRDVFSKTVVAVAGCSVGKKIIDNTIANLRPEAVKFADPKDAHVANAPRAGWTYEDIGRNKAISQANHITYALDPFIKISAYSDGLTAENTNDFLLGNTDIDEPKATVIVEETDDLDMKIKIRENARKAGIPVVMIGDLGSAVLREIRRFDLDPQLPLAVGISDEELFAKKDAIYANPGNLEVFYDFVYAMHGKLGFRDEFENISRKKVPLQFGGVPQLTSTVSAGAGIMAETIARMQLGWEQHERIFFDMNRMELVTEGNRY